MYLSVIREPVQIIAQMWPIGKLAVIAVKSWTDGQMDGRYTLNRNTPTCFVRTKPRGSVVITKPLALRMSLCSREFTFCYQLYSFVITRKPCGKGFYNFL